MSLFDPNVRFTRPPKRRVPVRRIILSWSFTAVIIGLLAASVLIGWPVWISTVGILVVLAVSTIIARRWR